MKQIHTLEDLRLETAGYRRAGERIALVPTMGNLHEGHLRLMEVARTLADRVVATLFVNPTQFGPGEDYSSYPRTPEADAAALESSGADVLFMPDVAEMYPGDPDAMTSVVVPGLSDDLCGAFRPGHFRGVATVVLKLFNMVAPDCAVFGEKDYQQLEVIRRLVADLNLPLEIHGVATVREPDGLAKSSRNAYLDPVERGRAASLYVTLRAAAHALLRAGARISEVEADASNALVSQGFCVDYVAVRRASDLAIPSHDEDAATWIILAAARLGRARLIDNLKVADYG